MIDIRLTFQAGASKNKHQIPLALSVSNLLNLGAKEFSAQQFSFKMESLGSIYSVSSYRDMAIIDIRSLSDPKILEDTIELVKKTLINPAFRHSDIQLQKKQLQTSITHENQNSKSQHRKQIQSVMYKHHPYSMLTKGNLESIKKINKANIQSFYNQFYNSSNVQVSIVGNLNRKKAENISNQLLDALPKGKKQPSVTNAFIEPKKSNHFIYKNQEQTLVTLAYRSVERGHNDYPALALGASLLGGQGLSSMLNNIVREEHGLVYSISSHHNPMQASGLFTISFASKHNSAQQALDLTQQTIMKFLDGNIDEVSLYNSKQQLISNIYQNLNTNKAQLGQLAVHSYYNLPTNYLKNYAQNIERLTKEDVIKAYHTLLTKQKPTLFILGKKALTLSKTAQMATKIE